MSDNTKSKRVFLLGNPDKVDVQRAMIDLEAFSKDKCQIVGTSLDLDGQQAVAAKADRIIVLGGDGTLIGVARSLGSSQIPIIGVNIGKLGFLAEFSLEELRQFFDDAITDDNAISRRTILQVTVLHKGTTRSTNLAINDCVIQAGPPFRIVTLGLAVNGQHLTKVSGDGMIVCTPTGSTAHNLSAGGPIVESDVDAIILTPLSPHSLTHKPVIVERSCEIQIEMCDVNGGTTAIIDGQVLMPLEPGDCVTISRADADFLVVKNPARTKWHNLVAKLHWGQSPLLE